MTSEIIVDNNEEGYKVTGLHNGKEIISASNRFLRGGWEFTSCSTVSGEINVCFEKISVFNDVMAVVKKIMANENKEVSNNE